MFLTVYINAILPEQPLETALAFPLPRNWSLLWAAPFRHKAPLTTKRHSPSVFRKQKRCHKATLFCCRAFLLPVIFLPLLKQPLSLFRLVKCLDLGQQEPGEALQLLLGHAVLPVLGGRRCLCCCLFLPIFRSGSFLQGCPLLPCCLFFHRS